MPRRSSALVFLGIVAIATLVVTAVALLTNRMTPEWDMKYYLDMAADGVIGNKHLVAPFAYRPAAPLLVGAIARALNLGPEVAFRICAHLMCVVFIVCCFYFAKAIGAHEISAALLAVTLALNFQIVKWNLFAGAMVDIYAYPLILLAFWLMIRKRFYPCLFVSAIGLFFKEFMILPLLTQAAAVAVKRWRNGLLQRAEQKFSPKQRLSHPVKRLAITLLVLCACFLLPRLFIHVVQTFQDIDPINQPSSLRRLYWYPESLRRDFNIVFAYLSWWLPALLLVDAKRLQLIWNRLRPYRLLCGLYLGFHFLLVMYGGTNLDIFATYSLPVLIMVLAVLLDQGAVQLWERVLMVAVVIGFNRIWMHIPLPQEGLGPYLNFYGGYHMLVTRRSLFRFAELLIYVAGFWALRAFITRRGRETRQREAATALANSGTSGISNS